LLGLWLFMGLVVLVSCGKSGGPGATNDSSPRTEDPGHAEAGVASGTDGGNADGIESVDAGGTDGVDAGDAGGMDGADASGPNAADAGGTDGADAGGPNGVDATESDACDTAVASGVDAKGIDASESPPAVMTSFGFKAVVNGAIKEDVLGAISGTTIHVALPYGTARARLRASFVSTGSSVTVNGQAQVSGATANDFSSPVQYVVHGAGGDTVAYTVIVSLAGGLIVGGHTPGDHATGISVHASIEIDFSEAVSDASLSKDSVSVTSGAHRVLGSTINDPSSRKVIFVPYGLLPEDADLSVTVSGSILSTTALGLDTDVVFTFHTGFYEPEKGGDSRVFSNFEAGYIRKDLNVTFTTDVPNADINTGWSKDLSAAGPDQWSAGATFDFDAVDSYGTVKVFARAVESGTPIGDNYTFVYKLVDAFPPASEEGDCDCVDGDDDAIVAWATSVNKTYGGDVADRWKTDSLEGVCSMGNGGVFDYFFNPPISDGVGADFVVGENGFRNNASGLIFAELFYVEVSSNGVDYLRFDSVSLTTESGPFLALDPGEVYGLGSTQIAYYTANFRQPYDLAWLRNKKEILDGKVDLSAISHVRYVDIPGTDVEQTFVIDGKTYVYSPAYDSFGNVIRDAYRTADSGGADVFTPGALHVGK
jgi:hypothetical protein